MKSILQKISIFTFLKLFNDYLWKKFLTYFNNLKCCKQKDCDNFYCRKNLQRNEFFYKTFVTLFLLSLSLNE